MNRMVTNKLMQAGSSIIEIQIYGALLALFLVVLSQLFVNSLDIQMRNRATSAIDQEAKYVLLRVQYDILRASSASIPAGLGDTASSLQITVGGQTYLYSVVDGVLQMSTDTDTYNLTSPMVVVSNLQVTRTGNPGGKHLLQINFGIDTALASTNSKFAKQFSTVVGMRI